MKKKNKNRSYLLKLVDLFKKSIENKKSKKELLYIKYLIVKHWQSMLEHDIRIIKRQYQLGQQDALTAIPKKYILDNKIVKASDSLTNIILEYRQRNLEYVAKFSNEIDKLVRGYQPEQYDLVNFTTPNQLRKKIEEKMKGVSIIDKSGRHWRLDTYSKMASRTTFKIARNKGVIDLCEKNNIDLVKLSEHFPTCPICLKYQGKIYSISGSNPNYPPLDSIFGKYGVIHPNCIHSIFPIIE